MSRLCSVGATITRKARLRLGLVWSLLFALPVPDTDNCKHARPGRQVNYALDPQAPIVTVEPAAMPARWDWPLNAPLKLQVSVVEVAWRPDPKDPRLPLLRLPCRNRPGRHAHSIWLH